MPDPQHVPHLPQEETDLIRAWHELGYETARQEVASGERLVRCLGLDLIVPPEVLAPAPVVAEVLGRSVLSEAKRGRKVRDLGTGCGINGTLAAGRGCDVLAVDINPHAVAAAATDAVRNGVGERFRAGDLATARSLMDRSELRRTVVDRLKRERDGRLVEYIAYRLSR
ncbi:50S ribosomal protein L11 methyltransferase [Streptomyces sp. NPDC050516]|uniref:50S ribosomal protein L11 methyltransferase n=1 Tax=Streptomyces sp. NPDC050516 TaxID=3365621 RepID=UPI0037A46090